MSARHGGPVGSVGRYLHKQGQGGSCNGGSTAGIRRWHYFAYLLGDGHGLPLLEGVHVGVVGETGNTNRPAAASQPFTDTGHGVINLQQAADDSRGRAGVSIDRHVRSEAMVFSNKPPHLDDALHRPDLEVDKIFLNHERSRPESHPVLHLM